MEHIQITYTGQSYPDERIRAIKALRGLLDLSLRDAKNSLEEAYQNPGAPIEIKTHVGVLGTPDSKTNSFLTDLENLHVITSINSPINDIRTQLTDLIGDAIAAECYGLASDIALVCDKYFGLSKEFINGDK